MCYIGSMSFGAWSLFFWRTKMKSPLTDIAAILMCMLLVILVGQYYIHKKSAENNSLQQVEKRVELKEQARPKIDMSSFQSAVKRTE